MSSDHMICPEPTEVNRAEERFVRERREDAAPDITSQIDDPLHAIRICHAKTVARKCFDFDGPNHADKMLRTSRRASGKWPNQG